MLDRLLAGGRGQHAHAAALEHAAQREDVARIVVDEQHRAADQVLVGAVQPLQHPLLLGRQVGDHPVQEQRRLVEQALGRFDALDDDAARHGVQLRVLLGRQLAAGEHDDRNVGEARVVAHLLQHLEAASCRAGAGRAPRSRCPRSRSIASASAPLSAVTMSMSSWPSSSRDADPLGRRCPRRPAGACGAAG